MSYVEHLEAKRERERALILALHGNTEQTRPGLPPIEVASYDPRPSPMLVDDDEDLGPGWRGPSYVIPNGAKLLGLTDEDAP